MHTVEPSGLGHYVSRLVLAIAQAGVPVALYCPANSQDEDAVLHAGIEIIHAAVRDTSNANLLLRLCRNFVFLVRTAHSQFRAVRRGDVVHFQGMLHLPLGFVLLCLPKLQGASVVLTAHDPLPHRWRLPRALRRLERAMLHLSYRLCDNIIVHNRTGEELLRREFNIPASRISVVPHGWYAEDYASTPDACSASELSLLAFGSIRENKGLHLAIAGLQMANRALPSPARLTIAGHCDPAEEAYWNHCKQLIAAAPAHIEVIDRRIDDAEVAHLFARHHALLLPYTNFSSESGVATLALSRRRALLATASGGLGELISQADCGVLIRSQDAAGVAEAIRTAANLGPQRLLLMGIEGHRLVREARSWESVAEKTSAVYARFLPQPATTAQAVGAQASLNL
jgi:glycosyltransferase involved in cell wall biosynthesis